jgi:HEPN domain-containing protein
MERKNIRGLIARAAKDLELAKRHRKIKEYVTAILLYNKAVEKSLKAFFISKTKREPPANASIEYLAKRTGVPEEISMYINSVQENKDMERPADFVDLDEATHISKNSETEAFYMDGLANRILDYVTAYIRI